MTEIVETENGPMQIDWDVPVLMSDGLTVRADVFRPVGEAKVPVLISMGTYGKGLPFQEGYASAWQKLVADHPEIAAGSSNRFQNWEVADPERWVPLGYACVRVDSRGSGRSPGHLDNFSERETQDYYECIEWAGTQDWSTGKVGLSGISYLAMNQWQVAALRPPHLTAMCAWEGASDWYREGTHHGGILCGWTESWFKMQVVPLQHGGPKVAESPLGGLPVTGDVLLDADTLESNRVDYGRRDRDHAYDDDFFASVTPDLSQIEVPLLSAGNWGGAGLHLRGNVEGFLGAGSAQKWLELHGLEHWTEYYTSYGRQLQQQFFDHFLKGEQNGWDERPPVIIRARRVDGTFEDREEAAWPLPSTVWTELHLDARDGSLATDVTADASITYQELQGEATFRLAASDQTMEVTGPLAMKLFISSDTDDADLFVVVRVFDPDENEVTFVGALDPHTPPAQGWLRASHRQLDPARSLPYRPYHPHDSRQPLEPGEIYEVDVEIWPTSLVLPAGFTMAVTVQGHDYEFDSAGPSGLSNLEHAMRGSGPFVHVVPSDRPIFDPVSPARAANVTIHTGTSHPSRLVVPFVPR